MGTLSLPPVPSEPRIAPWEAEPYRLWSLLDMFLFRVSRFCYLAQYISESASYHTGDPSEVIPKENRLADELDAEVTFQEVNQKLHSLLERFYDELDLRRFFRLSTERVHWYEDPSTGWETSITAFPSIAIDVDEAGKCFALARYTACVYHLSRVAEASLDAIAKRLKFPEEERATMEGLITYLEGQQAKKHAEHDTAVKGDLEFLAGVAAHGRKLSMTLRHQGSSN